MSTIRTEKLVANSDHNFEIQMGPTAHMNILGGLAIDKDSGLVLPSGTTAERPASPDAGTIRFNTTEGTVEGWDGSQWLNLMTPEGGTTTGGSSGPDIPRKGLVLWWDCQNPASMKQNASDQDANYLYDISGNGYHAAIPSDRITSESISGKTVYFLDFSENGNGNAKCDTGTFTDTPYYPHCTWIFFMKWRTTDDQWRTPLRSRDADHHIIVQSGTKNLGMYDNNATGFNDTGYDINQFSDWDSKFNMYTWRMSSYESGTYSPNYQCFFKDETSARATMNSSNTRYNRGAYHIGAWGRGNRDPHDTSQNAGDIAGVIHYNRHITQAERTQIYDYYKGTFNI